MPTITTKLLTMLHNGNASLDVITTASITSTLREMSPGSTKYQVIDDVSGIMLCILKLCKHKLPSYRFCCSVELSMVLRDVLF